MRLPKTKALLALSVLALAWTASVGFINPNFTPVDLVKQSVNVVVLDIKGVDDKGVVTAVVAKILKDGEEDKDKFKAREIKIDLMAGIVDADGKAVIQRIKDGDTQIVMFVGKFAGNEEEGQRPAEEAKGFIHLGGAWIVTSWDEKAGTWDMEKTDDHMLGTWSGGTDMLVRVVKYVLSDANAELPVREAIEWDKQIQVGKLEGKVYATTAVDLAGDGRLDLFVAAEKGDHLYQWDGKSKTFEDITAKSGLTSHSQAFAWGDFNGDGRVDLASWDGKELAILAQSDKGTFAAKVVSTGGTLKDCLSLTTFDTGDAGTKGRPALLAGTKGTPLALVVQDDGSAQARPIFAGELPTKGFENADGKVIPGECLVADFDNDGVPDVIQLFERAGLFYKGTKVGVFAAPIPVATGFGNGRHGVCIGDWDGDGLLDVFTCSEERNHLWQNMGGANFVNSIERSGSVAYIGKSGGIFVQMSNFNHDGRQGLLMLYNGTLAPQLFFNRGFRSFGLSRQLEGQMKDVEALKDGQQAGYLADFTGIGAQSLITVLNNGEIWFFPRKLSGPALGVTVSLSTASPSPGPVTVWANNDKRSFGAAVIRAGEPGVFYGAQEAGPVTIKWRLPGGAIQQKDVIVEDKMARVVVDKVAGAKTAEK